MQGEKQSQKTPVLLFLLEYNKFHEILKAILNTKVAKTLLQQYGEKSKEFSKAEQFRISNAVNRFTILQVHQLIIRKQLIELKGSSQDSVKNYQNLDLLEMIRRRLIKQKVDHQTRKGFWVQYTDLYVKPNFYEELKLLDFADDFLNAIEKDIRRTQKEEVIKIQAREVLQLFSHYNPYVGYCQGMNTIIAFLISRGFSCQESFFIFKRVTEELLPCGYYSNMDNIMAYSRIFYEMLSITHPQIYRHLKKIGEEMENTYVMMVSFVLQWFVCLYCNDNVYEEITEVIWDFFLVDGIVVLFKAAFAYFDLLKPVILQCYDFESYNTMQKQCIKQIKDVDYFRKRIIETQLSPRLLFLFKEKLMQPSSNPNLKPTKRKVDISYRKSCHKNFNVCFQALQDNLQQDKSFDIFVFKPAGPITIIPNYLQTLNKQYFRNEKPKEKVDSLVIGRIQHVCRSSSDTKTQGSMSDKNVPEEQMEKTPQKSQLTTPPKSNKSIYHESEQKIREKVCEKIGLIAEKKSGIRRSESFIFMEEMVKNVSISNLLELYDIDQLFQ